MHQPRLITVLTLAGTLPFLAGAVLSAGLVEGQGLQAPGQATLMAYATAIISFMCGARWGLTVSARVDRASWHIPVLAVMPALGAWLAVTIYIAFGNLPGPACVLAALLVLEALWDTASRQSAGFSNGYIRLRWTATLAGSISLLVAAATA